MTKLPQVKARDLIKAMKRLDFSVTRITGSHARLVGKNGKSATIPIHTKPIPKGTLKSILRQSEITLEELVKKL